MSCLSKGMVFWILFQIWVVTVKKEKSNFLHFPKSVQILCLCSTRDCDFAELMMAIIASQWKKLMKGKVVGIFCWHILYLVCICCLLSELCFFFLFCCCFCCGFFCWFLVGWVVFFCFKGVYYILSVAHHLFFFN